MEPRRLLPSSLIPILFSLQPTLKSQNHTCTKALSLFKNFELKMTIFLLPFLSNIRHNIMVGFSPPRRYASKPSFRWQNYTRRFCTMFRKEFNNIMNPKPYRDIATSVQCICEALHEPEHNFHVYTSISAHYVTSSLIYVQELMWSEVPFVAERCPECLHAGAYRYKWGLGQIKFT
jgi:hypothetical protein